MPPDLSGRADAARLPRDRRHAAPHRRRRSPGCTAAGVRVTMITGDHPNTASAVAAGLGIPDADRLMTGASSTGCANEQRTARVAAHDRVRPGLAGAEGAHRAGAAERRPRRRDDRRRQQRRRRDPSGRRRHRASPGTARPPLVPPPTWSWPNRTPRASPTRCCEGRALWDRVRDAASILVGGNAGEVAFTVLGTAIGGARPWEPGNCCWSTCSPTCCPPSPSRWPPPSRQTAARTRWPADPSADSGARPLARNLAVRGGATALGATVAWGCGRLTGRRRRAGTMGLAALVGTQLGQTLLTARHSPLVVATTAASAAGPVRRGRDTRREPVLRMHPAGTGRLEHRRRVLGSRDRDSGRSPRRAGAIRYQPSAMKRDGATPAFPRDRLLRHIGDF